MALFVRTFIFQAFKIPTGSMEENLLVGDHLLVNKMLYATATGIDTAFTPMREVHRGDVVVFKYPNEPSQDFIKRVIALPGETIRIENKQVFINGERLDEPYVHFSDPREADHNVADPRRDNMAELTVGEGRYFVMGDNRDNSHDSRFWNTLPETLVKGRALVIYWSYEDSREAYLETDPVQQVRQLASVAANFFTRTRWARSFSLVR